MAPSGVRIREARPDDAEALARVHVASWQSAYRGIVPDAVLDALSWQERREQWEQRLAGPLDPGMRTWVAVVPSPAPADPQAAEVLAGFASFGPSRDDDEAPTTLELYAIYLAPGRERQGVGTRLVRAGVTEFAAGCERLSVWVLRDNVPARRFYARCGLAADGREKTLDIGGAQLVEVRCTATAALVAGRVGAGELRRPASPRHAAR